MQIRKLIIALLAFALAVVHAPLAAANTEASTTPPGEVAKAERAASPDEHRSARNPVLVKEVSKDRLNELRARERAAAELENYRGGVAIVLGTGALIVIGVILILVL